MKKRWLAILMAVMMAISLLPTAAWAEETPQTGSDYADLPGVNYFYFMSSTEDEDDAIVVATKVLHEGDEAITDFSNVVVPMARTQGVTGWYANKDLTQQVHSLSFSAEHSKITYLFPKIGDGFWLTFVSNGGTYTSPRFCAGTASAPTVPTKYGYDFGGWYTDEGLSTSADFSSITEACTLYAKWTPKTDGHDGVVLRRHAGGHELAPVRDEDRQRQEQV